jgi:hypothetical protein
MSFGGPTPHDFAVRGGRGQSDHIYKFAETL